MEQNQISQTDIIKSEQNMGTTLKLEWLQEESSELVDFILVESRKKKRENRKSLKISPQKRGKGKTWKVIACQIKEEGSLVLLPPLDFLETKRNHKNARPYLGL
jgi:molybdopterin-guanine dinucleotide biosynthesis protein